MIPLYNNAEVIYGALGLENGDIRVAPYEFEITAYQLGFLAAIGNVVIGSSVASGTVDDVASNDIDFVAKGIDFGYAFGDITNGSFVLGASFTSGEIQKPDLSNIKTSETEPYISYSKMSGEGFDYEVSLGDGVFDVKTIIPVGDSKNFRALIGYETTDDIEALTFGIVYKISF